MDKKKQKRAPLQEGIRTPGNPKCDHKWRRYGWTGGPKNRMHCESCDNDDCDASRLVRMTRKEQTAHNAKQRQGEKAMRILHGPWHAIQKLLQDPVGKPRKVRIGNKWVTLQDREWVNCREAGNRMDKALPRLEKQWPGRIHHAGVDDDHFCSADVYLITHEVPKELLKDTGEFGVARWMGVSVLHIPQCTGEKPTKFFLYDGHRKSLERALAEVAKRRKAYPPDKF